MDFFFLSYRDPLFGLFILVAFVFIVALSHYFWNKLVFFKRQGKIQNFIAKFKSDKDLGNFSMLGTSELCFLAKVYANEGVYDKSIELFLLALGGDIDASLKEELFLNLARAYMKAGFLAKAKEALVEVLGMRSRNIEALVFLKYIYIKTRCFKDALLVCDSLVLLGLDLDEEVKYLQLLQGSADPLVVSLSRVCEHTKRFMYEQRLAEVYPSLRLAIDLLNSLNHACNLEDEDYKEFFYAKNLSSKKVQTFKNPKLKMLKLLNDNDLKASLSFLYHCKECKSELLLFSYHCPNCYKFASVKISVEVKLDEKN